MFYIFQAFTPSLSSIYTSSHKYSSVILALDVTLINIYSYLYYLCLSLVQIYSCTRDYQNKESDTVY